MGDDISSTVESILQDLDGVLAPAAALPQQTDSLASTGELTRVVRRNNLRARIATAAAMGGVLACAGVGIWVVSRRAEATSTPAAVTVIDPAAPAPRPAEFASASELEWIVPLTPTPRRRSVARRSQAHVPAAARDVPPTPTPAAALVPAPVYVAPEILTAPAPTPDESMPTAASTPEVRADDPNLRALARAIAEDKREGVRTCFERALKRNPKLRGETVVALDLAAPDRLESVRVLGDISEPAFVSCVKTVMEHLDLPPISEEVTLELPFALEGFVG